MFEMDQRISNFRRCAPGIGRRNEENCNCPESPCCSYPTRKACSIQSKSYWNNVTAHFSGRCNCSRLSNTCQCSVAHIPRGNSGCSCGCSREGQRKWLEYLWKMETGTPDACRCSGISKTFRPWSPLSGTCTPKCSCCMDAGHDTHFFCNATDQNNLVARLAALHYNISRSVKWLAINLAIFIIAFFDEGFPTVVRFTVVAINVLNVCYYIQNLVKLCIALLRIKLERPAYWRRNCLWERNLPQDLTRYFEVRGEEFSSRYWLYFSNLVSTFRSVRSSPVGRTETEMGMDEKLRTLGDAILRAHQDELRANSKFEDAKYRVPLMKNIKQPIFTPEQLEKYWSNYDVAYEDEKVRLSKEKFPFQAEVPGKPSLAGNSLMLSKCNEDSPFYEVEVPSILRGSAYQHSCEYDVHPSPAVVTSGSFLDFMKIHYGKDYCSSLRWVANLKVWLSNKIKEVVEQFDMANCLLARHGAAHAQIGSSSIADLRIAFRQNGELLTFTPLLEFLSLTHNQNYLVWRYRALAGHPCLTSYCWQSGGDGRGNWTPEAGPCDSKIVLHFFCSYMDMKLPDLPSYPARKRPFSDNYLICSDKLQQALVQIAIVRQRVSPPHFNVFVKGQLYNIQGGSNNLFLAMACLIYCIKIYEQGKIGRVSLDLPGLDLLWIVGDRPT